MTPTSLKQKAARPLIMTVSMLAFGAAPTGCFKASPQETDSVECIEYACTTNFRLYSCWNGSSWDYKCFAKKSDAQSWCFTPLHIPCSTDYGGAETGESGDGGATAPWDPGPYITYNSRRQVYEIDEQLVQALEDAGFSQLGLDSARLEAITSRSPYHGYLQLVDVDANDLAYLLGLRTHDILVSIDGYDLGTFEDQLDAYVALQTESEFLLTIDRSGTTARLSYEIVTGNPW
jgi:hypothetical protein